MMFSGVRSNSTHFLILRPRFADFGQFFPFFSSFFFHLFLFRAENERIKVSVRVALRPYLIRILVLMARTKCSQLINYLGVSKDLLVLC